jgi:hypothetical protein
VVVGVVDPDRYVRPSCRITKRATDGSAAATRGAAFWRVFATALAVLTAEFRAYLDREEADPSADLVGFRQHATWLSREELEQLIAELRQAIAPGWPTSRPKTAPATCSAPSSSRWNSHLPSSGPNEYSPGRIRRVVTLYAYHSM